MIKTLAYRVLEPMAFRGYEHGWLLQAQTDDDFNWHTIQDFGVGRASAFTQMHLLCKRDCKPGYFNGFEVKFSK